MKKSTYFEKDDWTQFFNEQQQQFFFSLKGVVNNGGLFRSYKQGHFLRQQGKKLPLGFPAQPVRCTSEELSYWWGLTLPKDSTAFQIEAVFGAPVQGEVRFGSNARTFGWLFIVDEFGVTEFYKLKFDQDGKRVKEGITLKFERGCANTKALEEEKAELQKSSTSEFKGTVGERITVEGIIKKIHFSQNCGYMLGDDFYIFNITDKDGNVFIYKGSKNLLESKMVGNEEKVITAKFTVKKHEEFNFKKQTIVTRPSKLEIK